MPGLARGIRRQKGSEGSEGKFSSRSSHDLTAPTLPLRGTHYPGARKSLDERYPQELRGYSNRRPRLGPPATDWKTPWHVIIWYHYRCVDPECIIRVYLSKLSRRRGVGREYGIMDKPTGHASISDILSPQRMSAQRGFRVAGWGITREVREQSARNMDHQTHAGPLPRLLITRKNSTLWQKCRYREFSSGPRSRKNGRQGPISLYRHHHGSSASQSDAGRNIHLSWLSHDHRFGPVSQYITTAFRVGFPSIKANPHSACSNPG